jgi:hypothetical protein
MPMLPFFGSAPPAFLSARIKIEACDGVRRSIPASTNSSSGHVPGG